MISVGMLFVSGLHQLQSNFQRLLRVCGSADGAQTEDGLGELVVVLGEVPLEDLASVVGAGIDDQRGLKNGYLNPPVHKNFGLFETHIVRHIDPGRCPDWTSGDESSGRTPVSFFYAACFASFATGPVSVEDDLLSDFNLNLMAIRLRLRGGHRDFQYSVVKTSLGLFRIGALRQGDAAVKESELPFTPAHSSICELAFHLALPLDYERIIFRLDANLVRRQSRKFGKDVELAIALGNLDGRGPGNGLVHFFFRRERLKRAIKLVCHSAEKRKSSHTKHLEWRERKPQHTRPEISRDRIRARLLRQLGTLRNLSPWLVFCVVAVVGSVSVSMMISFSF